MRRCGSLLNCWVLERKHKVPKSYGTDVRDTRTYDLGLIREVTADHLHRLSSPTLFGFTRLGLSASREASSLLKDFILDSLGLAAGTAIDVHDGRLCRASFEFAFVVGDVVTFEDGDAGFKVGEVWHCLCIDGELVSIVNCWEYDRIVNSAGIYRLLDNPKLVFSCDITNTCIWAHRSDTEAMVLLPREYC